MTYYDEAVYQPEVVTTWGNPTVVLNRVVTGTLDEAAEMVEGLRKAGWSVDPAYPSRDGHSGTLRRYRIVAVIRVRIFDPPMSVGERKLLAKGG